MAVLPIQIIGPTFADGYCPGSLQEFSNDYSAGARLSSNIDLDNIVLSETAPADHTKLWWKLNGSLDPFAQAGGIPLYQWSPTVSAWVARHPALPGTHRWEEFAAAGDIDTYEGGSAGAVTATTGPFWEIDTNYIGRSPMSPGAIASSDPAKVLAYGEDYGAGSITLDLPKVPPHSHNIGVDGTTGNTPDGQPGTLQTGGTNINWQSATNPNAMGETRDAGGTGSPAAAEPFSVVHPVRGMSCIKRTARLYFVG